MSFFFSISDIVLPMFHSSHLGGGGGGGEIKTAQLVERWILEVEVRGANPDAANLVVGPIIFRALSLV